MSSQSSDPTNPWRYPFLVKGDRPPGTRYVLADHSVSSLYSSGSVILRVEAAYRYYVVVRHVDLFTYMSQDMTATYHEVTLENAHQKPRFDIDIETSKLLGAETLDSLNQETVELVVFGFQALLQRDGHKLDMSRLRVLTAHGDIKRSTHLMVNDWYHCSSAAAKGFFLEIGKHLFGVDPVRGARFQELVMRGIIDEKIYDDKHTLRIAYSYKNGERQLLPAKNITIGGVTHPYRPSPHAVGAMARDPRDVRAVAMFQFQDALVGWTAGGQPLPEYLPVVHVGSGVDVSDEMTEKVRAMVEVAYPEVEFHFRDSRPGKISLDAPAGGYHCTRCARDHDNDNPFICITKTGGVLFCCGRPPKGSQHIGDLGNVYPQEHIDNVLRYRAQRGEGRQDGRVAAQIKELEEEMGLPSSSTDSAGRSRSAAVSDPKPAKPADEPDDELQLGQPGYLDKFREMLMRRSVEERPAVAAALKRKLAERVVTPGPTPARDPPQVAVARRPKSELPKQEASTSSPVAKSANPDDPGEMWKTDSGLAHIELEAKYDWTREDELEAFYRNFAAMEPIVHTYDPMDTSFTLHDFIMKYNEKLLEGDLEGWMINDLKRVAHFVVEPDPQVFLKTVPNPFVIRDMNQMILKYHPKNCYYQKIKRDSKGHPVTDEDGNVIYKKIWLFRPLQHYHRYPGLFSRKIDCVPYHHISQSPPQDEVFNVFTGYKAKWVGDEHGRLSKEQHFKIQPVLHHIFHVWACGDEALFNHILSTLAFPFRTGNKAGVALIIIGEEGVGKGIVAQLICDHLYGDNLSESLNGPSKIAQRFNAFLLGKMFVSVNECKALEAGEKRNSQSAAFEDIKSMITDPWLEMEVKNGPKLKPPNKISFLFQSNNGNPVPTGKGNRRNIITACSSVKKGDHDYFNRITSIMTQECGDILYSYFIGSQIKPRLVDTIRTIPETVARTNAIEAGMNQPDSFLADLMVNQTIGLPMDAICQEGVGDKSFYYITTKAFHDRYESWREYRNIPKTSAWSYNTFSRRVRGEVVASAHFSHDQKRRIHPPHWKRSKQVNLFEILSAAYELLMLETDPDPEKTELIPFLEWKKLRDGVVSNNAAGPSTSQG